MRTNDLEKSFDNPYGSLTYLPLSFDQSDNLSTKVCLSMPSEVTVTFFSAIFVSTLDTPDSSPSREKLKEENLNKIMDQK